MNDDFFCFIVSSFGLMMLILIMYAAAFSSFAMLELMNNGGFHFCSLMICEVVYFFGATFGFDFLFNKNKNMLYTLTNENWLLNIDYLLLLSEKF